MAEDRLHFQGPRTNVVATLDRLNHQLNVERTEMLAVGEVPGFDQPHERLQSIALSGVSCTHHRGMKWGVGRHPAAAAIWHEVSVPLAGKTGRDIGHDDGEIKLD